MTQKSSKEAFVGYAVESSFAQDSETYSTRLQIMGDSLDVSSLQRPLVERGGVYQYMGDGDFDIPGAYGQINFSFEMDLYGHGSATNGALTETPLASLLGHALGGMSSSAVGGALDGGSHTTSSIASTNTTLQEGSIFRVGTPGDGRAEGYATTVLDSTSAYDLLVALPSAPQDDDDVYAMQVAHLKTESTSVSSDSSSTNNTLRFVHPVWAGRRRDSPGEARLVGCALRSNLDHVPVHHGDGGPRPCSGSVRQRLHQ